MKLVSIMLGQSVWLFRAAEPPGGVYLPEAIKSLKERYGFVQAPTTVQEFDPTKGIIFGHGKFAVKPTKSGTEYSQVVIDSLKIFTDGIVANTKGYTEDADQLLNDLIEWATRVLDVKVLPDPPIKKLYLSQLEVELSAPLNAHFPHGAALSKRINGFLESYGQKPQPFELTGFSMQGDLTKGTPPFPTFFTIQRREQMPFSSNIYFAGAPLQTADHLVFLEELEKLAS